MEVIQSSHIAILPVNRAHVEASLALIDAHRLDGYIGILLQLCLDYSQQLREATHDLVLVSSGKRLLQVARAKGLLTFNPETQTKTELDILLGP